MKYPELKPGAIWKSKNKDTTAIIVGPATRKNYKVVWMTYKNNLAVQQEYKHTHMRIHFDFTGEFGEPDKSRKVI